MTESLQRESGDESTTRQRWGRVLVILGAVLILLGIGTALWRFWPDVQYSVGVVDTDYPYPSRLQAGGESPGETKIPSDRRVVIPAIGADVLVSDGDEDTALRDGAYWHVETSLPGEGGTTTLAGHRAAGKFALLSKLSPGDYVILYWDGSEYDYEVTKIWTTTPDDTEPLDDVGYERLVLYTCVPRYLGNERTIVEAVPVP